MTLSIWRYSHLTLAVSSFLFIIIAAVTGIILAFEPISNQLEPYAISDLSDTNVATLLYHLEEEYEETISVTIDTHNYVSVDVITKEGGSEQFYINPITGKKIGELKEKAPLFKFATSLHRSLFLKSTGRLLVGFVSFLLFLITLSGIILIIKRQGSIRQFLAKVTWENFNQYFHVILGRWFLIPILIITITGVYLSIEKFNLLPKEKITHDIDFEKISESPKQSISSFDIFKSTKLSEVKKIEFPFSPDVEDYFLLQLKSKELTVNQITGEVLSEVTYPFTKLASYYSLILHTGQGSIIWSLVLLLASAVMLFFIYSGFAMTFERRKGKTKNKYQKNECEYVILVGSENGSTKRFAKMLYQALLLSDKKVYVANMNAYTNYPKMKYMLVLAATYGDGDAPANATKFLKLLTNTTVNTHSFSHAVVAFGSLSYAKYCQFGKDVQQLLMLKDNTDTLLPLHMVNNKSFESFSEWTSALATKIDTELLLDKKIITSRKKTNSFVLKERQEIKGNTDETFLLSFEGVGKKFTSGDLLGIYPNQETHERLYSIANINDRILLSVKKHEYGVCSNYLYNLQIGDCIDAYVEKNISFHFPKKATKVIMIATGTGIAPFLGMLQNTGSTVVDLYFGLRNKESLTLYEKVLLKEKLSNLHLAFSREATEKVYVQDLILSHIEEVLSDLESGTVLMICGSIAMQNAVFSILEEGLQKRGKTLSFYEKRKQILVDCY